MSEHGEGSGDGAPSRADRRTPQSDAAPAAAAGIALPDAAGAAASGAVGSPIPGSAGLCARCVHARAIVTARGSVFVLCEAAAADPRLARYPALPRQRCHGFEPSAATAT